MTICLILWTTWESGTYISFQQFLPVFPVGIVDMEIVLFLIMKRGKKHFAHQSQYKYADPHFQEIEQNLHHQCQHGNMNDSRSQPSRENDWAWLDAHMSIPDSLNSIAVILLRSFQKHSYLEIWRHLFLTRFSTLYHNTSYLAIPRKTSQVFYGIPADIPASSKTQRV